MLAASCAHAAPAMVPASSRANSARRDLRSVNSNFVIGDYGTQRLYFEQRNHRGVRVVRFVSIYSSGCGRMIPHLARGGLDSPSVAVPSRSLRNSPN